MMLDVNYPEWIQVIKDTFDKTDGYGYRSKCPMCQKIYQEKLCCEECICSIYASDVYGITYYNYPSCTSVMRKINKDFGYKTHAKLVKLELVKMFEWCIDKDKKKNNLKESINVKNIIIK